MYYMLRIRRMLFVILYNMNVMLCTMDIINSHNVRYVFNIRFYINIDMRR